MNTIRPLATLLATAALATLPLPASSEEKEGHDGSL